MTSIKWKQFGLFLLASVGLGVLLGVLGNLLDLSPGVRGGLTGALIPFLWFAIRPQKSAEERSTGTR